MSDERYAKASASTREVKGVFSNKKLEEVRDNIRAVEKALDSVLNGEDSLKGACEKAGIKNYRNFREVLKHAWSLQQEQIPGERMIPDNIAPILPPLDKLYRDIGVYEMPKDAYDTVFYILGNGMEYGINHRTVSAIKMYYFEERTLEEIGKEFGVTRERVRQIITRGTRTMSHHSIAKILENGLEREKIEADALAKIRDEEIEQMVIERKLQLMEEKLKKERVMEALQIEATFVEELELSTRSYNVLRRNGYNTLGDVKKVTDSKQLMSLRNMGKRSFEEIVAKVREYYPDFLKEGEKNERRIRDKERFC